MRQTILFLLTFRFNGVNQPMHLQGIRSGCQDSAWTTSSQLVLVSSAYRRHALGSTTSNSRISSYGILVELKGFGRTGRVIRRSGVSTRWLGIRFSRYPRYFPVLVVSRSPSSRCKSLSTPSIPGSSCPFSIACRMTEIHMPLINLRIPSIVLGFSSHVDVKRSEPRLSLRHRTAVWWSPLQSSS